MGLVHRDHTQGEPETQEGQQDHSRRFHVLILHEMQKNESVCVFCHCEAGMMEVWSVLWPFLFLSCSNKWTKTAVEQKATSMGRSKGCRGQAAGKRPQKWKRKERGGKWKVERHSYFLLRIHLCLRKILHLGSMLSFHHFTQNSGFHSVDWTCQQWSQDEFGESGFSSLGAIGISGLLRISKSLSPEPLFLSLLGHMEAQPKEVPIGSLFQWEWALKADRPKFKY